VNEVNSDRFLVCMVLVWVCYLLACSSRPSVLLSLIQVIQACTVRGNALLLRLLL
jgi:hypothetical protein